MPPPNAGDRRRPKRRIDGGRSVRRQPAIAPGALEHFGQDQHGHVAAHTVALFGDRHELVGHRGPQARLSIVQLEHVGPTGKIGIAAVGENPRPGGGGNAAIVRRLAGQILFGAGDIEFRVRRGPGMIEGCVIGDEIEHQPRRRGHPIAGENGPALRCRRNRDGLHTRRWQTASRRCRRRSGREAPSKLLSPEWILPRDLAAGRAGLPNAEQPNPIPAVLHEPIEFGVGNVVERRLPPKLPRQPAEPNAGVELVEQRIFGNRHGSRHLGSSMDRSSKQFNCGSGPSRITRCPRFERMGEWAKGRKGEWANGSASARGLSEGARSRFRPQSVWQLST